MASSNYSKIYYQIADEFPEVFMNNESLGQYVRLLILHDQAWPSVAMYPMGTNKDTLASLVVAGLVIPDDVPGRYRIKGLDKERKNRSESARHAAKKRWDNAAKKAEAMPSAPPTQEAVSSIADARRIAEVMPSKVK